MEGVSFEPDFEGSNSPESPATESPEETALGKEPEKEESWRTWWIKRFGKDPDHPEGKVHEKKGVVSDTIKNETNPTDDLNN